MVIDKKLEEDIKQYCKLNKLNVKEYVTEILRKAFLVDKYGESPFGGKPKPIPEETEKKNNSYVLELEIENPKDDESDIPVEEIVETVEKNIEAEKTVEKKPKRRKIQAK